MNKFKLLISFLLCVYVSNSAFAADKSFTVATNPNWPPLEMRENGKIDGKIVGYDIDIINAIADELGLKVKILSSPWDGIFATLDPKAREKSDVIASTVTITEDRKKKYLFSQPYYEIRQSVIVPNNSTIKNSTDLKNKNIGVQIGTSAEIVLQKINLQMNIKIYDTIADTFIALKEGKLDAVICDDPVGLYYANRKDGFQNFMKLGFITGEVEELGFVFHKNNTKLVDDFNKALNVIRENGKEAEIRRKWFGEE